MEKKYLFDYVNDLQDYWAHTKTIEQSEEVLHELLTEHIERTCKYFNLFWQRKNCEEILDKFCNVIWQDVDNELKNEAKLILKEMIKSIPVFHDIGKINIKFQREVMKSPLFKYDKGFNNTRHSMLSAIIYIDYFRYDVLSDLSEELIDILEPFVLYHAYIISRHHSDLNDFEIFTSQLKWI